MVTIRSPGGQTRRKFKESCSQCAFVKVKCGKEKPTCTRCQTRGLRCNYEVSHRAGRRPAAERVLSTDRISTSTRPTPVPQSPPAASSDKSVEFAAQFSASLPSDIDELCGLALPNIHSMSGTEISTGEGLSPYLLGVLPSERSFCDNATKSTRGQPDTLSSALVDPYKLWPGLGDIPNQFDSLGTSSSSSTSSLCNGALMGQNSCSQKMLAVLSGAQNDTHYKPWLLSPSSPGVGHSHGVQSKHPRSGNLGVRMPVSTNKPPATISARLRRHGCSSSTCCRGRVGPSGLRGQGSPRERGFWRASPCAPIYRYSLPPVSSTALLFFLTYKSTSLAHTSPIIELLGFNRPHSNGERSNFCCRITARI
jgi:Fungal Zn(2)-Cys(6) binuclear cluster domain.